MTRTTRPPSVDLAALFPEIAAYAASTVRLHPRRGEPTAQDSHLGGPLHWPTGEPWPRCGRPKAFLPAAEPGEPMVVAGQFYARDLPELPFPEGADLLQVLWCPHEHEDLQGSMAPYVVLCWRDATAFTPSAEVPPQPELLDGDDSLVPRPCVLHPERVSEYPWHEELPAELNAKIEALERELGDGADERPWPLYQYWLSVADGSKIGGGVSWAVTDQLPQPCLDCGTDTEHLLTIADSEWDGGSGGRWRPVEEDDVDDPVAGDALGTYIKSAVRLFRCPVSPEHPIRVDRQ